MSVRKCIYTNRSATGKDRVIPKKFLSDETHNWANRAPISWDYRGFKKDRMPTDLEFEALQVFYLSELAQLKLNFYALTGKPSDCIDLIKGEILNYRYQLQDIQKQLDKPIQDKEIKTAQHEYQILEEAEKDIDK